MTAAVDHQADALLLAIVEISGGDLRAAFGILCARVTLAEVTGETFEAALSRAVRGHFGWPEIALLSRQEPTP